MAEAMERVPLMLPKEQLGSVDEYRFRNRIGTRAKAMRELIDKGLEAENVKTGEAA